MQVKFSDASCRAVPHLTGNEGKPLLLPFTGPALGWLYDEGDQLLHSLLLFQKCYQASIQSLALLQAVLVQ